MNFENGGTMRKELYLKLEKFSLRYAYFLFFDTREYLADSLFIRHQVRVWFEREYGKDGSPLLAICCHVKKKDVPAFLAALEDLKDKTILCPCCPSPQMSVFFQPAPTPPAGPPAVWLRLPA